MIHIYKANYRLFFFCLFEDYTGIIEGSKEMGKGKTKSGGGCVNGTFLRLSK